MPISAVACDLVFWHPSRVRITHLNPDEGIGASCWLASLNGHNLLLDAGTHPGRVGLEILPLLDSVKDVEVDAIALSHCHLDHVGALPVALRYFPQAPVFMTVPSYFLVERVLHNSVNVMVRQRDESGIKGYPLFSHEEVDDYAAVFQGIPYRKEISWGRMASKTAGPTLEFFDAGHTLGSAGVLVKSGKSSLFYSGDVCFHDQTLLRGARFDEVKADTLILESTRGNHAVAPGFTRQDELDRLEETLQAVLSRNGPVLIPAFGLGRTQEILAFLALLMQKGKIRRQPVYIGGLGRVFTEIYDLQAKGTHRSHPKLRLTEALQLTVLSGREVESIGLNGPKIFVMTAGMMTENTGSHTLAMRMLENPRAGICFVGYTDPESPAGRLRAAAPGQEFLFSAGAGHIRRRCRVETFDLTAHALREDLVDWVEQMGPKTVVLGHGEHEARQWMAAEISARLPKVRVLQPVRGETVECSAARSS